MKEDGAGLTVGPHHSLLIIEQCDDHGARTCVVCGERWPGVHFRIRPLKAAGYRVVCGYCLRGLVSEREAKAKRRK
jgi:hypothetical protein